MLKKLFVIILFGMDSGVFSSDNDSDNNSSHCLDNKAMKRARTSKELYFSFNGEDFTLFKEGRVRDFMLEAREDGLLISEKLAICERKHGQQIIRYLEPGFSRGDEVLLEMLKLHQEIDGRKIINFSTINHRIHSDDNRDNGLYLCKLAKRDSDRLFVKRQYHIDFDSIAVDPIRSQYQTVASSDLYLQRAINILKEMLFYPNRDLITAPGSREYYGVEICDSSHKNKELIRPNFAKRIDKEYLSYVKSLTIDDTIDAETLQRLSKSQLFAAQIYTELLKKRPREVDGVRIIYLSEPEEVDEP